MNFLGFCTVSGHNGANLDELKDLLRNIVPTTPGLHEVRVFFIAVFQVSHVQCREFPWFILS